MDPMQPGMQPPMTASKSKMWMWVVVAVVVVAIAALAWWWYATPQPTPGVPSAGVPAAPLSGGDTAADINKDLGAVDIGGVEQELNQLDADINQL